MNLNTLTLICIGLFLLGPNGRPLPGVAFAAETSQKTDYTESEKLSDKEIEALKKKLSQPKTEIENRLKLAWHYHAIKDYDQVIELLKPVVERLHISGMRLLAKAYDAKKDYLQVVRVLQFLLTQNENDYVSQERLGQAYMNIQHYDDAIKCFQKSITINKRYRPAYDGLLAALDTTKKKFDRREALVDMVGQFGEQPDLLDELCKVYYTDGFLEEAQTVCQKAIVKSPDIPDNHVYLGLTLQSAGNLSRAITIVQRAAKQFPKSEIAQYTAGQLNDANKNTLAAYRYYKNASEADATSFRSWLGLANMAFETKNYEESLKAFENACRLNRGSTDQDFRNASAKLKSTNNYLWIEKFNSASLKCRYQSS